MFKARSKLITGWFGLWPKYALPNFVNAQILTSFGMTNFGMAKLCLD